MSEHLIEMAKAKVLIKDGEVRVLTDPKIRRCPLRQKIYGNEQETRETIKKTIENHIKELGMYTDNRVLELDEDPISFGASEMMMNAFQEGIIESAVVVCDGAGTVVVTRPKVVQAIGAHMTGLIRTDPIPNTQNGLRRLGSYLLDEEATIDQVKGVRSAIGRGFKRIAVTITGLQSEEAEIIREIEEEHKEVSIIIMAVHNSEITEEDALTLADNADLVWACASQKVREIVGKKARIQIGIGIPVFALTDIGKRIVLNRAFYFKDTILIQRRELPLIPEGTQPEPLI